MENNILIEATDKTPLSFGEIWILALLSKLVDDKDADYFAYSIPVKNIEVFVGFEIASASSTLLRRGIKWTFEDITKQIRIFETNIINTTEWIRGDETLLLVTLHPKIRPFLANFLPKTKDLQLPNKSFLNLGISQRIFLVLAYLLLENQTTCFFELEKLKVFLGISGKYVLFSNFKIKILEESRKRIKKEIGLIFDYDELKKGKRVFAIRFRLEEVKTQTLFKTEENALALPYPANPDITQKMEQKTENNTSKALILEELKPIVCKKFGVALKMLKKLIDEFPLETIRQAIVITEKAIETGKIKGNSAGFFVEATRQNYQTTNNKSPKNDTKQQQVKAGQKAKELAKTEAKQEQKRHNAQKQAFEEERNTILAELKNDKVLQNTVIKRIKSSLFYFIYDENKTFEENLETPSFVAAVLNFVKMIKMEN